MTFSISAVLLSFAMNSQAVVNNCRGWLVGLLLTVVIDDCIIMMSVRLV